MEFPIALLGLSLAGAGLVDLFMTVLHYEGYGPISRRWYRVLWRIARGATARVAADRRAGILAFSGPLLLIGGIALWVVLVWVGFALVYLPALPTGFSFDPARPGTFVDALYYSGIALSTLGFGDIVPTSPLLQLVAVVEALVGFSMLTLIVAYLLGVYAVVREQDALAASIDDRTGATADPPAFIAFLAERADLDAALDDLYARVLAFDVGLHRYPIVYYFRRRGAHRSVPYLLHMVGETAAALRWAVPADTVPASRRSVDALVAAVTRLIDDLEERFVGPRASGTVARDEDGDRFERAARAVDEDAPAGELGEVAGRRAAWAAFVARVDRVVAATAADLAFGPGETAPTPRDPRPPPRATGRPR